MKEDENNSKKKHQLNSVKLHTIPFLLLCLRKKQKKKKTSTLFTLQIDAFHNIANIKERKRQKRQWIFSFFTFFLSQYKPLKSQNQFDKMNSVQSTGHTGSMSKKDQIEVIVHFQFVLPFPLYLFLNLELFARRVQNRNVFLCMVFCLQVKHRSKRRKHDPLSLL